MEFLRMNHVVFSITIRSDGKLQCVTLACSIAFWLTNANLELQVTHHVTFQSHHIQAVVATVYEESKFEPCVISKGGSHEGLFQVRDERRAAMHIESGVPFKDCVPAEAQINFMVKELLSRREGAAFFRATTYAAARSIFVRRYEVQLRTLRRRDR